MPINGIALPIFFCAVAIVGCVCYTWGHCDGYDQGRRIADKNNKQY